MEPKIPFFITGLPRSGSAWLANLFTTDHTVCLHEPKQSPLELIAEYPWLTIGIADSTLPLKYRGILERWPQARWLYVDRDESAAMRSFIRFTKPHYNLLGREVRRFWEMHQQARAGLLLEAANLLHITFEDLRDPFAMQKAWDHVLPGVQLNALRLEQLMNLRIEQDLAQRIKELPELLTR